MIPLHDDVTADRPPLFTVGLIVACTAVFLWQQSLGEAAAMQAIYGLGMIPAVLFGHGTLPESVAVLPAELTVITSMFMHGGWMHLIGNMLYLWIFGNNIEDRLGHARFVVFYLLSGIAAALAQSFSAPTSEIPMVGASGAVSGVLGAYLLLFPHARVLVLVPLGFIFYTVRLPALLVLGFWFLIQLISSLGVDPGAGGVAFVAHIGGFVAGMALLPLFLLGRPKGRR